MSDAILVVGVSCVIMGFGLIGFKAGFKLCEVVSDIAIRRERNKYGFSSNRNITISYIYRKK